MISGALGFGLPRSAGLLVDTNLLVLFTVVSVNRDRIETSKRTHQYTKGDFDLAVRVSGRFEPVLTVAHVLAAVSNLTDLRDAERPAARRVLKETVSVLRVVEMPSARAADDRLYERLGLAAAAISAVARVRDCCVLTDDFDLFNARGLDGVPVLNSTHLREQAWGA